MKNKQSEEECNVAGVLFKNRTLKNIDFENLNLQNAHFENCKLENVSFKNTILTGSWFKFCKFKCVNFEKANLSWSNMIASTFEDVCFKGANLRKAYRLNCNFKVTRMSGESFLALESIAGNLDKPKAQVIEMLLRDYLIKIQIEREAGIEKDLISANRKYRS